MRASLLVVVALGATAHADAKVDWATGLVTAEGVGIADRHAPSPAVARGTSRRGAEEAAKRALAEKIAALPHSSTNPSAVCPTPTRSSRAAST